MSRLLFAVILAMPIIMRSSRGDACSVMVLETPAQFIVRQHRIVVARAVKRISPVRVYGDKEIQRVLSKDLVASPEEWVRLTESSIWHRLWYWRNSVELCLVLFEVDTIVAGSSASNEKEFFLVASTGDHSAVEREHLPYRGSRPAQDVPCVPTRYNLGVSYLLMFGEEGLYAQVGFPFNDPVTGQDDAWLAWVRDVVSPADR